MLALELVLPVVKEVLISRARRAGPERQMTYNGDEILLEPKKERLAL